jgi:hypothetical protein
MPLGSSSAPSMVTQDLIFSCCLSSVLAHVGFAYCLTSGSRPGSAAVRSSLVFARELEPCLGSCSTVVSSIHQFGASGGRSAHS